MFDWDLNMPLLSVKKKNKSSYMKYLKLYNSFLWMGFNCFKATEPLRGGRLLFTTQSPAVRGTHLINFNGMKG